MTVRPKRWAVVALSALGVGLIVMPAVFQLWGRAPKGATMIAQFKPYMTDPRLASYQRDLREIDAGVKEADTRAAAAIVGSGPAARRRFDTRFPDFADFRRQWAPIDADMTDMLDTIRANVGNYGAVAALPSFRLFPWFFVLPGVLVLLGLGIARARPRAWRRTRWALVALGIGLVLAPAVFQMFERAPKGARMVGAFKTIETRRKVETIQGYFGAIAVGQGAVRLDVAPALRHSGLTEGQVASRFPAMTTLDRRWSQILGDLTPMIGTMSDNVGNYDAVAALPSFRLFPWFFVLPGLLVAGLATVAGPRRRRVAAPEAAANTTSLQTERAA